MCASVRPQQGEGRQFWIWEYARNNGFVIVTADSDFLGLAEERGAPRFVRCEAGEASVENVDGIGKECGQAANELGREIGVEKKFQRKRRSRPNCEA